MLPVVIRPQPSSPQLYRLTITLKGANLHAYCMSTSVEDAFSRCLERMQNRHESVQGVVLVHGELADPNRTKGRSNNSAHKA